MQEPLSTMLLLESENKYPDCLWMNLEAIPIQSGSTDRQQLDLYLTLQFNEQWEPLLDGRFKFGLKGGELKLKLENGEISSPSRQLNASFCQIMTKSSEENPVWVFEVGTEAPILKGQLQNCKLGTLNVNASPCRVEALFEVSKQDVYLAEAEGLWRHDLSPNKHAVIERKLIISLWEVELKPYLSWVQLCYDCSPNSSEKLSAAQVSSSLSQLKELIGQLSEAKTNDFLELAKIAALDPMMDFVGGNLRGTTLNGVELSGANLCHANLRGADLTDADLSEANLRSAKLSGADLSGAYLENADLSDTDLHRASLALANLGGANLNGANLNEVNLSNANLSGAKVNEARFGNNPGLSDEMKLNLKQRGAIFQE
jgi:uncharacterized protein YjbI with pentapeptide repeats